MGEEAFSRPADGGSSFSETVHDTDQNCVLYRLSTGNWYAWTAEDGYSRAVTTAALHRVLPLAWVLTTPPGEQVWAPLSFRIFRAWASAVDAPRSDLTQLTFEELIPAIEVCL